MKALNAIIYGKERHCLVHLIIRLIDSYRQDYVPNLSKCAAFELLLIVDKMLHLHEVGRPATASALARSTDIPRSTVQRRLVHLIKSGLIEQNGTYFSMSAPFLNQPMIVDAFRRRVFMVVDVAQTKLSTVGNESNLRVRN
jgi:predicted HTH transcriptional regulator